MSLLTLIYLGTLSNVFMRIGFDLFIADENYLRMRFGSEALAPVAYLSESYVFN